MKKLRILLVATVVVLMYAFTTTGTHYTLSGGGYEVGDLATDFSLKNIDGKMVSLADFTEAKGFIVIFTCNTCPVSVANEDRILALDAKYKEKGYPVIAINPNNPAVQKGDSFDLMQVRAKEKGFTFPYLLDDGQKIYPQYGATATPHSFVLQKETEGLRVKYIGGIDDSSRRANEVKIKYVENAVDALLEGKPVEVTKTRAIGCSIKV
ncbi:MAG: thioredoxin family protein [Bacteroidia bacterium]|nr:thioredoxin family protein [Bacteroidia bacterium]